MAGVAPNSYSIGEWKGTEGTFTAIPIVDQDKVLLRTEAPSTHARTSDGPLCTVTS